MKLILTGASGHLGRLVAAELLGRVEASDLILTTRDPSSLADFAEAGAEVRRADFDEPQGLAAAFEGGERMLLISTDAIGARTPQHLAAIDAAVAAGVRFVAYTSIVNPEVAKPAGIPPEHPATEERLRASGLEWAFLRNSVYADLEAGNLAVASRTGQLVTNHGDGRIGYVAYSDCAAVAAAVLCGEGHAGKIYEVTGPEALDAEDRAEIFSAICGTPVEVVQVDDGGDGAEATMMELGRFGTFHGGEELTRELVSTGMPEEAARMFASFGLVIRAGHLDVVTPVVRELTGRSPRTLREVLEAQPKVS